MIGVVFLLVAFVGVMLWRQGELFCLSYRSGELRLVRGRVPVRVARELQEALKRMGVRRATLTARDEGQAARLEVHGVDDFGAQRLRNVFHLHSLMTLRAAEPPPSGAVWRWIGVSWLSWAFARRPS